MKAERLRRGRWYRTVFGVAQYDKIDGLGFVVCWPPGKSEPLLLGPSQVIEAVECPLAVVPPPALSPVPSPVPPPAPAPLERNCLNECVSNCTRSGEGRHPLQ
jgi:hypothetical protein